jgi:antitoxin component YwqK of YwqJK toxin-antitoxin module
MVYSLGRPFQFCQVFTFEIGGSNPNYPEMDGFIELTNPTDPKTTYFMKDGAIVAKRVMSTEYGYDVERWYIGGKLGRLGDLPAEIWYSNGQKTSEYWYKDGKKHRDGDLPAVICYKNGQKTSEHWYKDGKDHRDGDLPADIRYEDGQKTSECWYKDGKKHRDGDLPAMIWHKNGQKTSEHWYKDGKEYVPTKPIMANGEMAKMSARLAKIEAMLTDVVAKLAEK